MAVHSSGSRKSARQAVRAQSAKPPPLSRFAKPWVVNLLTTLMVMGWVSFHLSVVWLYYLMWFGADAPSVLTGQTELMTEHGDHVYVRPAEKVLWLSLMVGGFGVLAGGALAGNLMISPRHWDDLTPVSKGILAVVMIPPLLLAMATIVTGGRIPFGLFAS